jgi:hypothetical protein
MDASTRRGTPAGTQAQDGRIPIRRFSDASRVDCYGGYGDVPPCALLEFST